MVSVSCASSGSSNAYMVIFPHFNHRTTIPWVTLVQSHPDSFLINWGLETWSLVPNQKSSTQDSIQVVLTYQPFGQQPLKVTTVTEKGIYI